jgi:hypothetical protein
MKGISRVQESIGQVKENLFLLPSNRTTALLETELASEVGREKALSRAMKGIENTITFARLRTGLDNR